MIWCYTRPERCTQDSPWQGMSQNDHNIAVQRCSLPCQLCQNEILVYSPEQSVLNLNSLILWTHCVVLSCSPLSQEQRPWHTSPSGFVGHCSGHPFASGGIPRKCPSLCLRMAVFLCCDSSPGLPQRQKHLQAGSMQACGCWKTKDLHCGKLLGARDSLQLSCRPDVAYMPGIWETIKHNCM